MSEIEEVTNLISFSDFLKDGVGFCLERNEYGLKGNYMDAGKYYYTYFTEDALGQVDTRLIPVINSMFSLLHSKNDTVSTSWLNDTLTYWETPLVLKNVQGEKVSFADVMLIGEYSEQRAAIELKGYVFNTYEKDGISFIAGRSFKDEWIPATEMDIHYPGWKVRYDLLSSVNTEPRELAANVLQRDYKPIATESLPDTSFAQ